MRALLVPATALALAVPWLACEASAEVLSGLVRSNDAPIHAQPSDASPIVMTLQAGAGVSFEGPCDAQQPWCNVRAKNRNDRGRPITGWMRTMVMFPSDGVSLYEKRMFAEAAAVLIREIGSAGADPLVSSWLRFYLSRSEEETGQVDKAVTSLEEVIQIGPQNTFAPYAFLALAKLYLRKGDVALALGVYERMLNAFADYTVDFDACNYYSPVSVDYVMCSGNPSIKQRVDATRKFLAIKTSADRTVAAAHTSALQKARAWYDLGQAWEEADPHRLNLVGLIDTSEALRCYEMAVKAAPKSAAAGKAAWRLIDFSQPYEWEGDWQGKARWALEKYGSFMKTYPDHSLVGEALFKIAVATWVKAGYPELYGYIIEPDGWEAWKKRQTELEQWFDTKGFGGGRGDLVVQHPELTPEARRRFQDVVSRYPKTASAALAKYYVAVIDDYCLKNTPSALRSYERFVHQNPNANPYVDKAKQRIAVLRAQK